MANVILIDPADIVHDGKPTFRKGFPDERYDTITIKVRHSPEYQDAQPGDTLQYQGECFEVVGVSPMLGADAEGKVNGVVVFNVTHKGVIPC
jgi:sorbitol-specific phosphotransferase system component IIA